MRDSNEIRLHPAPLLQWLLLTPGRSGQTKHESFGWWVIDYDASVQREDRTNSVRHFLRSSDAEAENTIFLKNIERNLLYADGGLLRYAQPSDSMFLPDTAGGIGLVHPKALDRMVASGTYPIREVSAENTHRYGFSMFEIRPSPTAEKKNFLFPEPAMVSEEEVIVFRPELVSLRVLGEPGYHDGELDSIACVLQVSGAVRRIAV